jgi:hypothetical protein
MYIDVLEIYDVGILGWLKGSLTQTSRMRIPSTPEYRTFCRKSKSEATVCQWFESISWPGKIDRGKRRVETGEDQANKGRLVQASRINVEVDAMTLA